MPTVSVRYIVRDLDDAIAFYCGQLGFTELTQPATGFAMLARGDLRLLLSASGAPPGDRQTMPDGTLPAPGGWNRFVVEVDDLAKTTPALAAAGVRFRGELATGAGGTRLLVEDPSGNPVELFEPVRTGTPLAAGGFEVRPIGHVESSLVDLADAPNQGDQGAPEAWLVIHPDVREGIRDIAAGADLLVLTWLHLSRRDELSTVPGSDPGGPERGVFSTRSPARPNPIGLHRVTVLEVDDGRLRVHPLEAVNGTPLIDLKPVLGASGRAERGGGQAVATRAAATSPPQ
jgi:tRNA-Thr(GGU) m(6)t(6)A37 methyltransferase TsaA